MKHKFIRSLLFGACCIFGSILYSGTHDTGLRVENPGTPKAYISHNGDPLLAFGCHLEHMLFDNFDYELWSKWAAEHGMNHCRTRLFYAPIRGFSAPKPGPEYAPWKRTEDGKYNLTEWDEAYWKHFHKLVGNLEENGIIIHLLIWPQCTGGAWGNAAWPFHPDNNVNPETEFLRSNATTELFWQTLSKGQLELFEIQQSLLMKLIEETVDYNNIYYDLCHEPFVFCMSDQARHDAREFISETTRRFHEKYQELRPDKVAILGMDTDFTPPGEFRNWVYKHDGFNIIIKGNNNDQLYTTSLQSTVIKNQYGKPYCPQESCDWPLLQHIPDSSHSQNLSYYWPHHRTHLRKYVWRWMMAKSQLIDIYQKRMGNAQRLYRDVPDSDPVKQRMMKLTTPERYNPNGHNIFEQDAMILRKFWNALIDYPSLDLRGEIVHMHFKYTRRVLSSSREAVLYLASEPGKEGVIFSSRTVKAINLALDPGEYTVDIWKSSAPGGIINSFRQSSENGVMKIQLPEFSDDLVVHIH